MELILIIFIILLIFGAGRLPKIGESLGRMVGEFKKERKRKEVKNKWQKKGPV